MYSWSLLEIPRFKGLDLKTNAVDVDNGYSLDCENVYQDASGVIVKRSGSQVMFTSDETSTTQIDEIGSAKLGGTKYYFRFKSGQFQYSTTLTGALTTLSPAPAISSVNPIYWAVLDNKLFFVDGTNSLRYFDGLSILSSVILSRPTVAPTGGAGAGFDYTYTVDNGLGESPASIATLVSKASASTITINENYGPAVLVAGQIVRIYSKATTIAAANKLVATYIWTPADDVAGFANIGTAAISDAQPQLYTELGLAINTTAPTALVGLISHYGHLVGWKNGRVFNSKSSNPHSWPSDTAQKEAFVYGFALGDGEDISTCVSYRESLYVLKKTKVAIFGGIGPDDTGNNAYSFRRLETNGIGCIAGKSAVVVGDEEKNYLVYLSQQGFVATNGNTPVGIGAEIEPEIQSYSELNLSTAVAIHHKRKGVYICVLGPPTNRKAYVLDVREDVAGIVGWFRWTGISAKCIQWDDDKYIFGTYSGFTASERVTGLPLDFSDVRLEYILPSAIDTALEQITVVTPGYQTGDTITFRSNGTAPGGVTLNLIYYVIRVSDTVIKLAATPADATGGIAINITSQGTGTHSLVSGKSISAFYTTNWIKFGSASRVKKLGKPCLIFNAIAPVVNITMQSAYDWVGVFVDERTVAIGSTNPWGVNPWGSFVWGSGSSAAPKNVSIARRKVRSIRYRFSNNVLNQDFQLQGLEQNFDLLRNRGNFGA